MAWFKPIEEVLRFDWMMREERFVLRLIILPPHLTLSRRAREYATD